MRICTPHCGIAPETTSGGETYERELLERLGRAGVQLEIILARGKPHPAGVPNWTIHRFAIGRGLRWYVAPFVVPRGHPPRARRGRLRPPARPLAALHRPVRALGAPALPPGRADRVAPSPPRPGPAQPPDREAGRRRVRPGRRGQRVRPPAAPGGAGRARRPRLGRVLRGRRALRAPPAAARIWWPATASPGAAWPSTSAGSSPGRTSGCWSRPGARSRPGIPTPRC